MMQTKCRDTSLDVMKGLLITMVVLNHVSGVARNCGISNETFDVIHVSRKLYIPFFMPAFFVVTGMCSNFLKPFKEFLVTNFKSLIIPAIIITLIAKMTEGIQNPYEYVRIIAAGGGKWFLCSLFLAKLIYWLLVKLLGNRIVIGVILFLMLPCGVYVNSMNVPNVWAYQQAMVMVLFLQIGQLTREKQQNSYFNYSSLFVYTVVLVSLMCLNLHVPVVVNKIHVSLAEIPVYCVLSFTGTFVVLSFCRKIKNCGIFEFWGRESLIIYLVHLPILYHVAPLFKDALNHNCSMTWSFGIYIFLFVISMMLSSMIALLLRSRYLQWIKGKF